MPLGVFNGQTDEMVYRCGHPFTVAQHAVPEGNARVHGVEETAHDVEVLERDPDGGGGSLVHALVFQVGRDVEHEEPTSEPRAPDARATPEADERDRMVYHERILVAEPLRFRCAPRRVDMDRVSGPRLLKSSLQTRARSLGRGAAFRPIFAVDRHVYRPTGIRSCNETQVIVVSMR